MPAQKILAGRLSRDEMHARMFKATVYEIFRLGKEGTIMPYRWPDDTVFTRLDFNVEDGWCLTCGCKLTICDHRHRRLFTLNGPVHVVCKLAHCPHRVCPAHTQTLSPAAETALA